MDNLKPCPFCGEVPQLVDRQDFISVLCSPKSTCWGSGLQTVFFGGSKQAAAEAWNTRATPHWQTREEFEKSGYEGAVWVYLRDVRGVVEVENALYIRKKYRMAGGVLVNQDVTHVMPRQERPQPPED